MDSPLARMILSTLGGLLLILAGWSIYEWFIEEYPSRPDEKQNSDRVQHPFHHDEALKALKRFSELPKEEQTAIRDNLESNLLSISQWLTLLEQSDYQILCLGELHEENTRAFLAEYFFANFSTDYLLLEATPKELKRIINKMNTGRDYFPLLDADILAILRAATKQNPDIELCGIEQTRKQGSSTDSRDKAIAKNFWKFFSTGKRNVILFGALHCRNEESWLFQNLYDNAQDSLRDKMLNIQIYSEHQNGPVESFVFFLDEIGIARDHFVIADTGSLHPKVYELFQWLDQKILSQYQSLIVFRQ